jgi:CHAT domain-containing protein
VRLLTSSRRCWSGGRFTPAQRLVDATRDALLTELPRHTHFHFAGHGAQNLTTDDSAALYCHDHATRGPVTATDVAALRLTNAELAFLSACETARGNAGLPNEAAHLAGAMQLAGFRHVIATQWFISDARAMDIAATVYEGLAGGTAPAEALHAAVLALRERRPLATALWAPYLHIGP